MEVKEKKHYVRHGLYDHWLYRRWASFVQRCKLETSSGWKAYGARGISVVWEWDSTNENGFKNFIVWAEEELKKHPKFQVARDFDIGRRDVDKDFGPDNCIIVPRGTMCLNRRTKQLTLRTVIRMRRYKRRNPDRSLNDLEVKFGHSPENISRALRGVTWAIANVFEPPLLKRSAKVIQENVEWSTLQPA